MKLIDLYEWETIKSLTSRKNGDNSYTVRLVADDKVFVHSNKNKSSLEKLIRDRYNIKNFSI